MIRKLRKKFILAAVAAVFLVLLLLIGAINVLNFRSLVRDADSTLEILSQNGGRFPGQMFRPEDQPAEMIPPPQSMQAPPQDPTAPPDREEIPDTGRKGPFGDRRGGFGELAYQSRYFTASFDSEGNVTGRSQDARRGGLCPGPGEGFCGRLPLSSHGGRGCGDPAAVSQL